MSEPLAVVDLHCDTIQNIQAGENILSRKGHINIEKLKAGGVQLQVFACFISNAIPESVAFSETLKMLDCAEDMISKNSGDLLRIENFDDISALKSSDKIGVMLAVENGHAIARNLSNLEKLRLRGVRYMTLTHSGHLEWAASSGENTTLPYGLNKFGRKVVEAMNEMGMIVDVSHVAEQTFFDVATISNKPFIASHSNAAAICNSARNLTDTQLKMLADKDGMTGINFFPGFLDQRYSDLTAQRCGDLFSNIDAIEKELFKNPRQKMAAFEQFNQDFCGRMQDISVDSGKISEHILHIVRTVGADCVGFGSDFDGVPDLPGGVNGSSVYPDIIDQLRQQGLDETAVQKICGGNFLRVLEANE